MKLFICLAALCLICAPRTADAADPPVAPRQSSFAPRGPSFGDGRVFDNMLMGGGLYGGMVAGTAVFPGWGSWVGAIIGAKAGQIVAKRRPGIIFPKR